MVDRALRTVSLARIAVGMGGTAASALAFAHHPMDGTVPASLLDGLLSGFGHPVIEAGHLLFLLGAALVAALCSVSPTRALAALLVYVAGSTAGTLLTQLIEPGIVIELAVSATLFVLAVCLWRRTVPTFPGVALLPVLAGLAHGLQYGEAVIGAESTPLLAYLAGLALVQSAMLAGTYYLARRPAMASRHAIVVAARSVAVVASFVGAAVALGMA